jgi:hypothetical protein
MEDLLKGLGDNRPSAYMEDGKPIYRISAIGSCPKHLVRYFQDGHKTDKRPPGLNKAAASGDAWEEQIKGFLEGEDVEIIDTDPSHGGQWVVELKVGAATLRGHIDGFCTINDPEHLGAKFPNLLRNENLLANPRPKILFEAKEMNAERYDRWGRLGIAGFPGYAMQLALYLKATGAAGCLYAVGLRGRRSMDPGATYHLAYIRANDPALPTYASVVRQVMEMEKYRKAADGSLPECNGKSFFCAFKRGEGLCTMDDKGRPIMKPVVSERPDLVPLIREERALAAAEKAATAARKEKNDEIKAAILKDADGNKLEIAVGQSLSVSTGVKGMGVSRYYTENFSTALLEAKHPEIYADRSLWTKVLQVRVRGGKDDGGDGDE